jgi:hypothetical protein
LSLQGAVIPRASENIVRLSMTVLSLDDRCYPLGII